MSKEYIAKLEHISRKDDPKIYDLEDKINKVIEEIIKHRVEKYKEDFWKEALPTTLFVILDHWDTEAVKAAIKTYMAIRR